MGFAVVVSVGVVGSLALVLPGTAVSQVPGILALDTLGLCVGVPIGRFVSKRRGGS